MGGAHWRQMLPMPYQPKKDMAVDKFWSWYYPSRKRCFCYCARIYNIKLAYPYRREKHEKGTQQTRGKTSRDPNLQSNKYCIDASASALPDDPLTYPPEFP